MQSSSSLDFQFRVGVNRDTAVREREKVSSRLYWRLQAIIIGFWRWAAGRFSGWRLDETKKKSARAPVWLISLALECPATFLIEHFLHIWLVLLAEIAARSHNAKKRFDAGNVEECLALLFFPLRWKLSISIAINVPKACLIMNELTVPALRGDRARRIFSLLTNLNDNLQQIV